MSRWLARVLMLGALTTTAWGLGVPASASASWTTNGDASGRLMSFDNIYTSAWFVVVTTGSAPQGIRCSTARMSGSLFGPSLASGVGIASLSPSFGGLGTTCTVVGQNAGVKCGSASFNGVSYTPAMSRTSGSISGISCVVTKAACGNSTTVTGGITITGSVPATYGNTSQQMIIDAFNQSLSASWGGAGCLAGTSPGSAMLTGPIDGPIIVNLGYNVTSAFTPQITN